MYVDVYPLKRFPREIGPFTYRLPRGTVQNDSVLGRFVRISFRGSPCDGIIWARKRTPPRGVTSVQTITSFLDAPSLSKPYREFLSIFASQTYTSVGLALYSAIPDRANVRSPSRSLHTLRRHQFTVQKNRHEYILRSVSASLRHRASFLPVASLAERIDFCLTLPAKTDQNGQMLVLCPTQDECAHFSHVMQRRYGARVIVFHSGVPSGEQWIAWRRIAENPRAIVIGTKIALFSPWNRLTDIIVDLPSDDSHKQDDQNPRYHACTLAKELSRLYHSRCVYLDAQPTLPLWSSRSIASLPQEELIPQHRTVLHLHDSLQRSPLHDDVQHLLHTSSKTTLLFHNRKGLSRTLRCVDCGWVLRCPTCTVALGEPPDGHGVCRRCQTKYESPTHCPHCGSVTLRRRGIGLDALARYCKTHFSQRRVRVIDRIHDTDIREGDMIVASEKILTHPSNPTFATIVVISLDDVLSFPDFRSVERAYLLLERLGMLLKAHGAFILQTRNHYADFQLSWRTRDPRALYQKEFVIRSSLKLPPRFRIFRIIGNDRSRERIEESSVRVEKILRSLPRDEFRIEGAFRPGVEKSGKRYRRWFSLTCLSQRTHLGTLNTILRSLPQNWFVDAEPISLTL
jgi:primosomal protein N' (replication factor Y)